MNPSPLQWFGLWEIGTDARGLQVLIDIRMPNNEHIFFPLRSADVPRTSCEWLYITALIGLSVTLRISAR